MTQSTLQFPAVPVPRVKIRPLLRNVYLWMTLGLLITAAMAFVTSNSAPMLAVVTSPWVFALFLGQVALVFVLSARIMALSPRAATLLFLGYAALNGVTLSGILLYYDLGTLTVAFLSAAALFGVMSFVGLFTKADLSKWRTYLFIGLIGLLIALLINVFLRSSAFDLAISVFGVLLFTALTAYDTQQIARMASDPNLTGEDAALMRRLTIVGALKLYLDFINLFLYLLRLLGRGR